MYRIIIMCTMSLYLYQGLAHSFQWDLLDSQKANTLKKCESSYNTCDSSTTLTTNELKKYKNKLNCIQNYNNCVSKVCQKEIDRLNNQMQTQKYLNKEVETFTITAQDDEGRFYRGFLSKTFSVLNDHEYKGVISNKAGHKLKIIIESWY